MHVYVSQLLLGLAASQFHRGPVGAFVALLSMFLHTYRWHLKPIQQRAPLIVFSFSYLIGLNYWLHTALETTQNLSPWLSYTAVVMLALTLSPLFALPYLWKQRYPHSGVSLAMVAIVVEQIRLLTPFALPWCQLGYTWLHLSMVSSVLKTFGVLGGSYLIFSLLEWGYALVKRDSLGWTHGTRILALLGLSIILPMAYRLLSTTPIPVTHTQPVELVIHQTNLSASQKLQPDLTLQRLIEALKDKNPSPSNATTLPSLHLFTEGMLTLESKEYQALRQEPLFANSLIGGTLIHSKPSSPILTQSVLSFGAAKGVWHKQHTVPFGESIPGIALLNALPSLQRKLMQIAPFTHLNNTQLLSFFNMSLYPVVCYDVFFPLDSHFAKSSNLIVVFAENTWYGDSYFSHILANASMQQAITWQTPLVLLSNRGPSGFLNAQGVVQAHTEAFKNTSLHIVYQPSEKTQSFVLGPWATLGCCALIELVALWVRRRSKQAHSVQT